MNIKGRWSNWGNLKNTTLFTGIPIPPSGAIPIPFDYKSTLSASLFSRYNLTPRYAVQGFIAFDQTPTNDAFRSLLLPEADKLYLGLGGQVKWADNYALEVTGGYTFAINEAPLNNMGPVTQIGSADLDAYFVSFQFSYKD